MAYFLDQSIGSDFNTLQDIAPTSGQAFGAQVSEAWEANPSVLGMEAFRVARANANGERLSAYDAGKIATEAGLRSFAPGEGEYTREALDIVIERKRSEMARQDVIGRTPWSATGTPLRGLGMLAANLLDPLNVATAFVPVIPAARYTALVAGAGSAAGRAGVRAGVGALEGTVGMALLEPAIYGARQYLDDDYGMTDSLLNIAFGGLLGGGLHVVGGGVADALSPGRWIAARTLDDAIGNPDLPRPRMDRGEPAPGSAADVAARAGPEVREAALRTATAHMAEGKLVDVDPIYRASGGVDRRIVPESTSPESMRGLEALRDVMERQGDAPAALRHPDLGDVSLYWGDAKGGIAHIIENRAKFDGESPQQIAETLANVIRAAAEGRVERVRTATGVPVERGRVEVGLGDYLAVLSRDRLGQQETWLLTGFKKRSDDTSGSLNPRATHAVAPDVQQQVGAELQRILGPRAGAVNAADLRAAAARQASPESTATVDFDAARAADERLAAAPAREDVTAATEMADAAVERAKAARADLEARGGTPAQLKAFDEAMADADAQVRDAENLGRAVEAAATCGARAL
jgi:hypothetical protein